jgi:outer membrane protein W
MHKAVAATATLLLFAAAAFAQQPSRPNSISVFATKQKATSGNAMVDSAYGASFDHMFSDRWSGELSVSSQRSRRHLRIFTTSTEPTNVLYAYRIYLVDANVSYHFLSGSRLKPYLGAGLRQVNDTFHGYEGVSRTAFYRGPVHTLDPEISGGITLQLNRTFGLRVDAKQVLGNNRSNVADPERKASAGLSFRF